ncbi:MAG: hypothetical protein AAF269_17335 [Pseudomonadota bacterium]
MLTSTPHAAAKPALLPVIADLDVRTPNAIEIIAPIAPGVSETPRIGLLEARRRRNTRRGNR